MWFTEGQVFRGGRSDWDGAAKAAEGCMSYRIDVEEELVVDDDQATCYNCRYRRWTVESFTCQKR